MPQRLRDALRRRTSNQLRLFAPDWYEAKYGIDRRDAESHYLSEGHERGLAPTPLFDVAWYRDHYGPTSGPPLVEYERNASSQTPNRWLDPATLLAAGVAEPDIVEHLAVARIHLDDPRSLSPTDSALARVWRGRQPIETGSDVVILAHFDAPGVVSAAFLELVLAFVDANRIVVVCSTSIVEGPALEALRTLAYAVCAVPNTGHDWGAYQAGLRFALVELDPRSVVLANDSVYVVPNRLAAFLNRLDAVDADVTGATDSDELSPHLQSYLLRLGRKAFSGPLGDDLLTTYVPISEKELVIHMYELGLSRRAREHGLPLGVIYPFRRLAEEARQRGVATESVLRRIEDGIPVTPTLHLWRPLLEDGFPFVKRQLLRHGMASRDDLLGLVPERVLALAEDDIAARTRAARLLSRADSGRGSVGRGARRAP